MFTAKNAFVCVCVCVVGRKNANLASNLGCFCMFLKLGNLVMANSMEKCVVTLGYLLCNLKGSKIG